MSTSRPKDPSEPDLADVDVEPVVAAGAPGGGLTIEAPEPLTEEDLAARANVGMPLDLEDVLPGPPVGSERLLLEEDPEAARRLGLRSEFEPPLPPVEPVRAGEAPPPLEPAPPGFELPPVSSPGFDIDIDPVIGAPAASAPPLFSSSEPAAPAPSQPVRPPPAPMRMPPQVRSPTSAQAHQAAAVVRSWPNAFAWAGLGHSPEFAPQRPAQKARVSAPEPQNKANAEDLLELAAVGKDPNGITEMYLIFREDVLRGLTCTIRMEPTGVMARFVAPDETVRRYVESTAEDLLTRMRKRGMRVAGWSVEVSR